MAREKIQIEEYDKIVELYKSGLSKEKIEKMYGVSNSVIDRIFRIKGIKCRDNSHKGRKYTLNEHYFDNVDTPNKAYILGLLYADGTNYIPNRIIRLELQERDKQILEKINIELDSNRSLYFNNLNAKNQNHQNTYGLNIVNKHMSEVLNQKGMVQNKSLVLKFPEWLDENLYSHFIRGYFDGDGHIEWTRTKFVTVASTKEFCEYIKTYINNTLKISSSIYDTNNKESNTKVLHIFQKQQIKVFLDWIYKDAELYITRKYNTYQQIYNEMI